MLRCPEQKAGDPELATISANHVVLLGSRVAGVIQGLSQGVGGKERKPCISALHWDWVNGSVIQFNSPDDTLGR